MAEDQYPEYAKFDVVRADKELVKVLSALEAVVRQLKSGFVDLPEGETGKRVAAPQFSAAYNKLLDQRDDLTARQGALRTRAIAAAKTYVPLGGPVNAAQKKELAVVTKWRDATVAPTPAVTTTTPVAAVGSVGPQLSEIVEPTVTPVVPGTPTKPPTKAKPAAPIGDWQAELRKLYPSYSDDWLAENGVAYFGQDLIDLMMKVSAPGSLFDMDTAAGQAEVKRLIEGTNYWQTTQKEIVNFDGLLGVDRQQKIDLQKREIAAAYGDLGFDDATLTEVATNAARRGLTGLGLKQAVYGASFAATKVGVAGRGAESAAADRIRKMGRAWGQKISDATIQSVLTGVADPGTGAILTEDGLREMYQQNAIGASPHLADQFRAGSTLETITANYRAMAAGILEKSEDQVDMFSGPMLDAWSSAGTDGKSRQLGLGEWMAKLKSDARFGYQFTKQANKDALDLGTTIARAFGKVQ